MNWASLVFFSSNSQSKEGVIKHFVRTLFPSNLSQACKKKRYKYENENQIIKQYVKQIIILSFLGPEKILLPFTCAMT